MKPRPLPFIILSTCLFTLGGLTQFLSSYAGAQTAGTPPQSDNVVDRLNALEKNYQDLKKNYDSALKGIAGHLGNELVPIGAMLPYFGDPDRKVLPDGFVLADGKSTWPHNDAIPRVLWDKPIPDMTGLVPIGADASDVGNVVRGTDVQTKIAKADLPQLSVSEITISHIDHILEQLSPFEKPLDNISEANEAFAKTNGNSTQTTGGFCTLFIKKVTVGAPGKLTYAGDWVLKQNTSGMIPPTVHVLWIVRVK
jgi:hypothetical protein